MNTFLKKKNEFKPMFLYKRDKWIEDKIRERNEDAGKIRTAIAKLQELFDGTLTNKEVNSCLVSGWNYTESLLRKNSQFPNADIDTLLSLKGKDKGDARIALQAVKSNRIDEFSINKDEVRVKEETIDSIRKIGTYYTEKELQNEAIKTSFALAECINKGIEKGYIEGQKIGGYSTDTFFIEPFKHLLKLKKLDCGKWGVQPDPVRISML